MIGHASEKRKIEFTLGRIAAKRSAANLGHCFETPLLRGDRGQPLWPTGLKGAITHTRDIAAAATSVDSAIKAIGLDLEYLDRKVATGVASRICVEKELSWVHQDALSTKKRILQLFSAKEAFYKAVNPLVGVPIRYSDVDLNWQGDSGHFRGELLRDLSSEFRQGFRFDIYSEEQQGVLLSHILLLS